MLVRSAKYATLTQAVAVLAGLGCAFGLGQKNRRICVCLLSHPQAGTESMLIAGRAP